MKKNSCTKAKIKKTDQCIFISALIFFIVTVIVEIALFIWEKNLIFLSLSFL